MTLPGRIPTFTAVLAALSALLILFIMVVFFDRASPADDELSQNAALPPPKPVPATTMEKPANIAPVGDFAEIRDRPLFRPSRRPAPPAPAETPQAASTPATAASPLQNYALSGIILDGDNSIAMVRFGTNSFKSLRIGDMLDGWRVANILPDEVLFASGLGEYRIAFPRPPQSSPTSPKANR